jgi:hypothetical protein
VPANEVPTPLNASRANVKHSTKAIEQSPSTRAPHVKAYVIAGRRSTERDKRDPSNVQPAWTRRERARDKKQRLSGQGDASALGEEADKYRQVPILNKDMSKATERNEVYYFSDANLPSAAVYSCRAPCTPH